MINKSSGSMYEEIEQDRLKRVHKSKIIMRRVIVIVISSLIIIYLGLLLNDIRRYHSGANSPLILVSTSTKDYDDGSVTTYYSIGWVYRFYNRETIDDSEIAPIWSKIRDDDVLKRSNDPDLPEIETDYSVPSNYSFKEQIDGVLFFYDSENNLLGTYACLLSDKDCERSDSTLLDDDTNTIEMGIIDSRYVFITEYKSKDTEAEEMHVYLYDIKATRIIADYQGVRYSTLDDDKKYGYIDSSKYIIKKNGKWGIDQVIKGKVTNLLDYQYDYIGFDSDSNLYILHDDTGWFTYDANSKAFTSPIQDKIRRIFLKNDKVYYETYEIHNYKQNNYKLYNQDGLAVLSKDDINNLTPYDKFLTYTEDDYLYVIDYEGVEVVSPIKLFFSTSSAYGVKPYTIKVINNELVISTPLTSKATHLTNEYYYDLDTWVLLKTRVNVQETAS